MRTLRKLLLVLLALIAAGLAKQPLDTGFAADLRARRLLLKPLDLDTREALGQVSYAVALGGLRSLVATVLNLKAHSNFENQEWGKLEDRYQTITTLQPHTRYYWDVASWHLAYNAYADYGDRPGIPDARRRFLQKEYLERGIRFLEAGIDNNPDDWALRQNLVRVLTDPFKPNDLPRAAAILKETIARGDAPDILHREHLYALCRIPGREEEAWIAAQEVWSVPNNRRLPTVRLIYFALQWRNLPPARRLPLEELFADRAEALKFLTYYWLRKREGFPMDGVPESIELLLQEFKVPAEFSPLKPGPWKGFPPGLFESR